MQDEAHNRLMEMAVGDGVREEPAGCITAISWFDILIRLPGLQSEARSRLV